MPLVLVKDTALAIGCSIRHVHNVLGSINLNAAVTKIVLNSALVALEDKKNSAKWKVTARARHL